MFRYFLEISYKGTAYSGFQVQANAGSIQEEVEKAFAVFFRKEVMMTGASRTDTGVHARQNYFHFDFEEIVNKEMIYRLNAILPGDICIRGIFPVPEGAHCRFDAESREYRYYIYGTKNPFLTDRAYFYPYPLNWEDLETAAGLLKEYSDFASFSKRNTQVKHFRCNIFESHWVNEDGESYYRIRANRFLRGMVRGLTGTMLMMGRGQITRDQFVDILEGRQPSKVNFNVPAKGLFLDQIRYPEHYHLHKYGSMEE
ncbi:MAG TPA: tRNA pseudouridine(38-40) synthase TruA [Puia sp.]|jgi:tRNA pseudouridine38-40 synthase